MKDTIKKMGKFTLIRVITLAFALVVAVYLTVFIGNWGGEMDENRKQLIQFEVYSEMSGNPAYDHMSSEEFREVADDRIQTQVERRGLDEPFLLRSFDYLIDAITLDLGRSQEMTSDTGSRNVRVILLERIPPTLFLIATSQLITFFLAVFLALHLSRKYGSILDKLVISLAPSSAAPGWFYGLWLILIFAAAFNVLPWGGMVEAPPPPTTWGYALSLLQHMILPVSAMVLGSVFAAIYSWRTFFLIYSSEDYVELAQAKGLSSRDLERRYILRPTLPPIITNFLLLIITVLLGSIVLETVFNWPGLGRLIFQAINLYDTPVIVGSVVIYGYLLAAAVFFLDFIYAALDPRVRTGEGGGT